MRAIILVLSISGCFDPSFGEGIPCAEGRLCPEGQQCAFDNRCYSPDNVPIDTALSDLTVSTGELVPSFDPEITDYTLDLRLKDESVAVTATPRAAGEVSLLIDEQVVTSGEATEIPLVLGPSEIEILVDGGSDHSSTYNIVVDRGAAIFERVYMKASNTNGGDSFGHSLALDGDLLVVGAPSEDSVATEIDGDQSSNGAAGAGAAYVFARTANGWEQQAYLKACNTDAADVFGGSVAISGSTIAVGAVGESSASTFINGDEQDNTAPDAGAVYVFVRVGQVWSQEAYIKAPNAEQEDSFGFSVSLDADSLAVGAPREDSATVGVNGEQDDNSAMNAGAVYVFRRSGAVWSLEAYLKASNTDTAENGDQFGMAVSLRGDTLAVGALGEDSNATGVNGDQLDNSVAAAGAVYVFGRNNSIWTQEAYVKATRPGEFDKFGQELSLSEDADLLVVAAPSEDSDAEGVDGDQMNDAALDSGAVYVLRRAEGTWRHDAYLKPSNTKTGQRFGRSVSASKEVVVVGSPRESASSRGINGNEEDEEADLSGAVYVFERRGAGWVQRAFVKASNADPGDFFGRALSISGGTIAVGASSEDSNAVGVNGDPTNNEAGGAGAAYIVE